MSEMTPNYGARRVVMGVDCWPKPADWYNLGFKPRVNLVDVVSATAVSDMSVPLKLQASMK